MANAEDLGSYKLVVAKLDGVSGKELRGAWDAIRDRLGMECACVLASVGENGKVALLAGGTDAAIGAGFSAGSLIKEIAPMVGGRGGGRPGMAQAGGSDASSIGEALQAARNFLGVK